MSRSEIFALRELRGTSPDRVISDEVCTFWFDLGLRHLAAPTVEFQPLSQNSHDEALAVRPCWRDGPCTEDGRVVLRNAPIAELFLVRTVLWFTDHVLFRSAEEALSGRPPARNDADRALHRVLASSTGGHSECVSHPDLIPEIDAPVANLVDVGFVVLFEGQALGCFARGNSYLRSSDFVDVRSNDFRMSYELISLETALERTV